MTILVITEKKNVRTTVAKILGAKDVNGHKSEGNGYILINAEGHIMEAVMPEEYDEKYKSWNPQLYPFIPSTWKIKPVARHAARIRDISEALKVVDEVYHIGDPDAEGQLIVDEILDYFKFNKKVSRILFNENKESEIKKALKAPQDNKLTKFRILSHKALLRSRLDFLMGINGTRIYSSLARKFGYDGKEAYTVGRVMTPTAFIVLNRELEIENFVPVSYVKPKAELSASGLNFVANLSSTAKLFPPEAFSGQNLIDKDGLKKLMASLKGKSGVVSSKTSSKQKDEIKVGLTTTGVMALCGKKLKISLKDIETILQDLYDKYSVITYPRVEVEVINKEEYFDKASNIVDAIKNNSSLPTSVTDHQKISLTKQSPVFWPSAKMDAKGFPHGAIVPTDTKLSGNNVLPTNHQRVYDLIATFYLALFMPDYVTEKLEMVIKFDENTEFKVTGKSTVELGYAEFLMDTKKDKQLPQVNKGESVDFVKDASESEVTKPPERFSDTELASEMGEIAKYLSKKELKDVLKDVGLGTGATRGPTITKLIEVGLLEVKKFGKASNLVPSARLRDYIGFTDPLYACPDFTAIFEKKSASLDGSQESYDKLYKEVLDYVCKALDNLKKTASPSTFVIASAEKCPKCSTGFLVTKTKKGTTDKFKACNNYPTCNYIVGSGSGSGTKAPIDPNAKDCTKCGEGKMILRNGKNGKFYGCSNYPKCSNIENIAGEGGSSNGANMKPCPKCGTGKLRQIKGPKGMFFGCTSYPDCKHTEQIK